MENAAIEEEIYRAIRRVKPSLEDRPLSPQTRFDALELESIERVTVVFEIEEVYSISILDQNLDTFRTVAEARDVVARLLAEAASKADGRQV
jgi:acyl carrier protein